MKLIATQTPLEKTWQNRKFNTMSFPSSMSVIEMHGTGRPDVLQLGTRPLPVLRDHEILVKVSAAGVNGPDLVQRRGYYPPPKGASDLLGLEVSGEVVSVGAKQTIWAIGDKICGLTNGGGYAEYVAIDVNSRAFGPSIRIIIHSCFLE